MTETKWLAGHHLGAMAEHARRIGTARQQRLIGCACCRSVWDRLGDPRNRHAVEVAEDGADGLASDDELERAGWRAEAACFAIDEKHDKYHKERRAIQSGWLDEEDAVADNVIRGSRGEQISFADARVAAEAAEFATSTVGEFFNSPPHPLLTVDILRDIFGNPFRPVSFDQCWRTDTALSLARVMYETRDFAAMPILADALQDAGCEDADILDHCRGGRRDRGEPMGGSPHTTGPHIRGCWVVDLVLGKA